MFAGTLDALLFSLYDTQERYPDLRPLVEQTVLKWNYCELFHKRWILDLMSEDGQLARRVAARPFPLGSKGFASWGFLDPDPDDRVVPLLLSDPTLGHTEFQYFFHRVYREHCFPHPETGRLFTEEIEAPLFAPLRPPPVFEGQTPAAYPFSWESKCTEDIVAAQQIPRVEPAPSKPSAVANVAVESESPPQPTPPAEPADELPVAREPPNTASRFRERLDGLELPGPGESPEVAVAQPSTSSAAGVPTPLPQKDSLGFTGNFYHRWRVNGEPSVGSTIAWAPAPYWFIRAAFDLQYELVNERFSYSWGVGYDDWHPGTWSFQLNNWGPILSGEGLKVEASVFNIAYKFKSDLLKQFHLSGSAGIDMHFSQEPVFYTTWQWEPIETWFIRVGIQIPLSQERGLRWTYNFGRWDWRPFTVALTYDNWGINEIAQSNLSENGAVNLAFSWAF